MLWGAIGILLECVIASLNKIPISETLYSELRLLLDEGSTEGNKPLWYLVSLFVVRLLYTIYGKFKINPYVFGLGLILLSTVLYYTHVGIPLYVLNIITGLFFFLAGNVLKDKQYSNKVLFASIVLFLLSLLCYSGVDMRANRLIAGYYPIWFVFATSGCVISNNIAKLIPNRFIQHHRNYITLIGRESMGLYVSHWPVLLIFLLIIEQLTDFSAFNKFVIVQLLMLLYIVIYIILKKYEERNYNRS